MPKVRFEIYSTERGKKLIDLGELLVESGYLHSFHLDEEGTEVVFNFEIDVGFDVEKEEIDMDELRDYYLSLIHISEPTRPRLISYAVFCLKK